MDIKDWILIGGGVLLAAVVGHGFWLAWRSRRDTLRMDIDPNVPREDVDELVLLRAELPNGGARVKKSGPPPEQGTFDLGAGGSAAANAAASGNERPQPTISRAAVTPQRKTLPRREPIARPIVPERSRERLRQATPIARAERAERAEKAERAEPLHAEPSVSKVAPDVIVINVLARNGGKFSGSELLEAFLRNGLKFGDMNIFHRIAPATKVMQFSVASAVEPGTFDLSTMETFKTPGVSFFLRLPGPEQPLDVFDDMLAVCRDVAASLSADLKDEQLSVMTAQTIAHCRSRIEDFSRRRMSQRA